MARAFPPLPALKKGRPPGQLRPPAPALAARSLTHCVTACLPLTRSGFFLAAFPFPFASVFRPPLLSSKPLPVAGFGPQRSRSRPAQPPTHGAPTSHKRPPAIPSGYLIWFVRLVRRLRTSQAHLGTESIEFEARRSRSPRDPLPTAPPRSTDLRPPCSLCCCFACAVRPVPASEKTIKLAAPGIRRDPRQSRSQRNRLPTAPRTTSLPQTSDGFPFRVFCPGRSSAVCIKNHAPAPLARFDPRPATLAVAARPSTHCAATCHEGATPLPCLNFVCAFRPAAACAKSLHLWPNSNRSANLYPLRHHYTPPRDCFASLVLRPRLSFAGAWIKRLRLLARFGPRSSRPRRDLLPTAPPPLADARQLSPICVLPRLLVASLCGIF